MEQSIGDIVNKLIQDVSLKFAVQGKLWATLSIFLLSLLSVPMGLALVSFILSFSIALFVSFIWLWKKWFLYFTIDNDTDPVGMEILEKGILNSSFFLFYIIQRGKLKIGNGPFIYIGSRGVAIGTFKQKNETGGKGSILRKKVHIICTRNFYKESIHKKGLENVRAEKRTWIKMIVPIGPSWRMSYRMINVKAPSFITITKQQRASVNLIANLYKGGLEYSSVRNNIKILFYGAPGSGKSVIGDYLAYKFDSYLFDLDVSMPGIDVNEVLSSFTQDESRPLILRLDEFDVKVKKAMDTTTQTISLEERPPVTDKSTLSSVLDFLDRTHNVIVLYTSNEGLSFFKEEEIKFAFREGRVDLKIEMLPIPKKELLDMAFSLCDFYKIDYKPELFEKCSSIGISRLSKAFQLFGPLKDIEKIVNYLNGK